MQNQKKPNKLTLLDEDNKQYKQHLKMRKATHLVSKTA
jgi:hypothetical protein